VTTPQEPTTKQGASTHAPPPKPPKPTKRERHRALRQLDEVLERPMIYLGIIWAVLIIVQFTRGLSTLLAALSTMIWIVFIVDFIVRMVLAPYKVAYLKRNWFTALSLFLPALRIFRLARLLRFAAFGREASLVRVVSSLNRGMGALGGLLGRRGFGYVAATTVLVTLGGAAGMYAFEHDVPGSGITGYWTAVWWTAMVMTTMGSDYFPRTMQGRVLCVLLALYAFTVFGYVTATLATFFVDREAASPESDIPDQKGIDALRREVAGLRSEIQALVAATGGPARPPDSQPTA